MPAVLRRIAVQTFRKTNEAILWRQTTNSNGSLRLPPCHVQARRLFCSSAWGTEHNKHDDASPATGGGGRLGMLSPQLPVYKPASSFSGFELTFLGTSSQGCARRYPSSLVVRLRSHSESQAWLFDAGEGALAQLQRSHLRVSQLQNIFITHMHSDHVFGLPSIVMAVLAFRKDACKAKPPLTVYGPPGIRSFLRAALGTTLPNIRGNNLLRIVELALPDNSVLQKKFRRHSPYWKASLRQMPFEEPAERPLEPIAASSDLSEPERWTYELISQDESQGYDTSKPDQRGLNSLRQWNTSGSYSFSNITSHRGAVRTASSTPKPSAHVGPPAPATVQAAFVNHTVPCIAYTITENMGGIRFDKEKLESYGISTDGTSQHRDVFQRLAEGQTIVFDGRTIRPEDVARTRRQPRRVCIVGDTSDASNAAHIAQDVDVLVHEATMLASETDIARKRGHSSSRTAAEFAKKINARRVILNHTSVGYTAQHVRMIEAEARAVLGNKPCYVAHDMSVFNVPFQDDSGGPESQFRVFLGHPRWDRAEIFANAEKAFPTSTDDGCKAEATGRTSSQMLPLAHVTSHVQPVVTTSSDEDQMVDSQTA